MSLESRGPGVNNNEGGLEDVRVIDLKDIPILKDMVDEPTQEEVDRNAAEIRRLLQGYDENLSSTTEDTKRILQRAALIAEMTAKGIHVKRSA